MKGKIAKMAVTAAIGLSLAFGTVSAQNHPGPAEACLVNGQEATVFLPGGQRFYECHEGDWYLIYSCSYTPFSDECVID